MSETMTEEMERIIFGIIVNAGDAKSCSYEALKKASEGDFESAKKLMLEADEIMLKAHEIQTNIIRREAGGEKMEVSVLFVHAQDHLMTAMSEKNLISQMILMYEKFGK